MDTQTLFNVAVTLAGFLGGWILNSIYQSIRVLDKDLRNMPHYYVTKDDLVILASEVGVLDIPPERVLYKGRLEPGRMLLIDTRQGRIIGDEELKHRIATEHPYREWLNRYQAVLDNLPAPLSHQIPETALSTVVQRQQAFGNSMPQ